MAGSKEDSETVTSFFEDMKRRGLNDPLLVTSDGAPGIIKAIEICFSGAARQRCLAYRMRNLVAKVPEDVWPEFKVRVQAAYQAPSRAIARELAAGVVADYSRTYDSAVGCFMDDFEGCIAYLRFPVTHRRAIQTTNLLERLFVEERRRLKIIPNAFGERAVLKLTFGALRGMLEVDHRLDVAHCQVFSDLVAIITFVAEEPIGIDIVQLYQCIIAFDFMRLAGRYLECQRVPLAVRAKMDFGPEAAARAAERFLILIPPLRRLHAGAPRDRGIDGTFLVGGRSKTR
jgi:hypothetical protein